MNFKGIKLITFDVTNTILKFTLPPWQHYVIAARDQGFSLNEDEVKRSFSKSYKTMWEEYPNFGRSTISWEEWWRRVVKLTFEDHLPVGVDVNNMGNKLIDLFKTSKCWRTADDGKDLLKLLKERRICVGAISNFDPRLYDILKSVNIYNNFDFILTSYEVGYPKPDERIFNHALRKCKEPVWPFESLHIGDDIEKDYKGARAAGWHAILITETLKTEKPPAPEHVFKNLKQFSLAIKENKLKF